MTFLVWGESASGENTSVSPASDRGVSVVEILAGYITFPPVTKQNDMARYVHAPSFVVMSPTRNPNARVMATSAFMARTHPIAPRMRSTEPAASVLVQHPSSMPQAIQPLRSCRLCKTARDLRLTSLQQPGKKSKACSHQLSQRYFLPPVVTGAQSN